LAEEYYPHAKRLVGNFLQAFSHIALVNSAHNLVLVDNSLRQRAEHPQRSEPQATRGPSPSSQQAARLAGMSCALWLHNYGLHPVIIEKEGALRPCQFCLGPAGSTSLDRISSRKPLP
jgi:hypothetical protein